MRVCIDCFEAFVRIKSAFVSSERLAVLCWRRIYYNFGPAEISRPLVPSCRWPVPTNCDIPYIASLPFLPTLFLHSDTVLPPCRRGGVATAPSSLDVQSPRPPPEISHSGYNGASSSNDGGADDADRAGPLDRSVCASSVPPSLPLSSIPSAEASASAPAPPPAAAPAASPGGRSFSSALPTAARGGGVDHLRDVVAGRFMSPAVAAAAASMAVALGNGRGRGDSGNGGYGDGGDGDGEPLSQVGFEIRAAAGTTATAAPEIGGSSSVSHFV